VAISGRARSYDVTGHNSRNFNCLNRLEVPRRPLPQCQSGVDGGFAKKKFLTEMIFPRFVQQQAATPEVYVFESAKKDGRAKQRASFPNPAARTAALSRKLDPRNTRIFIANPHVI
jgi:hypothetical protein